MLNLQQKSGTQSDGTSSARQDNGLAGTGGDDGGGLGRPGASALGGGGVDVGGGAGDRGVGGDGLGQGARAVGDRQGGGLGDRVGLAVVGQGGGLRAVGSQGSDDLGGVGHVASRDGGGQGEDGSDRELHFDGVGFCREDGFAVNSEEELRAARLVGFALR